jgi:signal transduction histidine kinase
MARPLRTNEGNLVGQVALAIPLALLREALAPPWPNADSKSQLWRSDGLLLATSRDEPARLGKFFYELSVFKQGASSENSDIFIRFSPVSSEDELLGRRNNAAYPVVVSSGMNKAFVSESYRSKILSIFLAAVCLLSLIWFAGYFSDREIRTKDRAIADVKSAREKALVSAAIAERESQSKSLLLARFSHEFRTPLNAVIGYTEMARLGYTGPISDRLRENLAIVQNAAEQLNRMIGTVLDLSRLELDMSALTIAPCDLKEAVRDAASMSLAAANSRLVRIDLCFPESACLAACDRTKIVEAMLNLLSNAVRHSPTGGTIQAMLELGPQEIRYIVQDQGPGIAHDKMASVFEPFGGMHPDAVRSGGTGLGLSISRQIMTAHGGSLILENVASGGLRAIASIPLSLIEKHLSGQRERVADMSSSLPSMSG